MIIELDMYQTLAIAVVVLMLGKFLRKKCSLLEKFCIPAPVVGGVLFAVFTCVCYVTGIMFWKWSKKKEQVYHVGNEDVAVPEVHTGKVAHEQAAQQDTGEKENIHYENVAIPEVHIPHKKKK